MSGFDAQLERLRSMLDHLAGQLADPDADAERLLKDAVGDLDEALTELGAVGEELERQNSILVQQKVHLDSLFESAPIAMMYTDCDGVVERVNTQCAEFFGVPVDSMIARPVAVLVDSRSNDALVELIAAATHRPALPLHGEILIDGAIDDDRVAVTSVVAVAVPNEPVTLRWSFLDPIDFDSGEPSAMGIAVELNEVLVAVPPGEDRFRRIARQFRRYNDKFLEALDSLLVVVDAKTGSARLNGAARDLVRSDRADSKAVDGRDDGWSSEYRIIHETILADLRNGEGPAPFEYAAFDADRGTRRIRWTVSTVTDSAQEISQIIYSGRDISHERELEDRLATLDRMESVGLLASGLAHDFNNLLTIAVGNLELAIDTADISETGITRIEAALGALDRGSDLTRRLMAMVRRPDGVGATEMVVSTPRSRDVSLLVEDLVELVSGAVGSEISFDTSGLGEPVAAAIEPTHLEQVLLNLISNACDAMHGRGRIAISSALSADSSGMPSVEITVRDDGPGMDAEHLQKMFDPLFSDAVAVGHAGLGLATSRLLIESVGGSITASSIPGDGTSICVRVPIVHRGSA